MVEEGVNVKFRWFRTVETDSGLVILEPSEEQWQPIELVWDRHKLMYESEPFFLPRGKHETNLIIDGERYPCQAFSVVGTTFEVNLFLQEEIEEDQRILMGTRSSQSGAFSPLQVDVLWSPTSFSPVGHLKDATFAASGDVSSYDFPQSQPMDIYVELVASKDREIERLRQEIMQLKLCLVEMDTKANLSTAHSQMEASQAQEMSEELSELQKEKTSLEQETESMVSRIKENEMERESLEWEVQQLREWFSGNDPSEVMQLLVEMKSLRQELRIACRKNRELAEEVLKLRDENTRLVKDALVRVVQRDPKLNDSIYFSDDPESASTQYKELPCAVELSQSLPILVAPGYPSDRTRVHQRSASLGQVRFSPPDSNGSVLTDELLSFGTPNKGVQTDITALHGSPTRYRNNSSRPTSYRESSASTYSQKTNVEVKLRKSPYSESKARPVPSLPKLRSFKEDGDSSDTDELLREADRFILTAIGDNVGMSNGVNGASTMHTNPSTSHNNSSSKVFGKLKLAKTGCLNLFMPKCALDLQVGHMIRYHGLHGRVTQGKVSFVGLIPDQTGTFVGVEDEGLRKSHSSDNPRRTFIPFKKVILAWDN